MMLRFLLSVYLVLMPVVSAAMGPSKSACGLDVACPLGERSYHIRLPDDWDGTSALPVMLHFHGWMRQGSLVVNHARISGATQRRGVLLVAPNGRNKTWNFWGRDNADVEFAAAVLEDVARRYPVDRSRLYVSGYSYGSAMAWRYVCENGQDVTALLAIAGTLQQSEDCPQAPAEVRHVHGLADQVMDFPMGAQGDTTYPVALWRAHFGCGEGQDAGTWQQRSFLTLQRKTWECDGGRVTLDLHPGGHFIPHGWIARQLDELLGLPLSYP